MNAYTSRTKVLNLDSQYAEELYGNALDSQEQSSEVDGDAGDIEADIKNEIEGLRRPTRQSLFQSVKTDIHCGKY